MDEKKGKSIEEVFGIKHEMDRTVTPTPLSVQDALNVLAQGAPATDTNVGDKE